MQNNALVASTLLLLAVIGCGRSSPVIQKDFTTPEGAVFCLNDAMRAKDLEAAVRCWDFRLKAHYEQWKMDPSASSKKVDEQAVQQRSEYFRSGYRKYLTEEGFPDMTGIRSSFARGTSLSDDLVLVLEVSLRENGPSTIEKWYVAKTPDGWRVLDTVD